MMAVMTDPSPCGNSGSGTSVPNTPGTDAVEALRAESAELDALVAALTTADWNRPTPAPGWTVAHQIGHLTWSDTVAALAMTSPEEFAPMVDAVLADGSTVVDDGAAELARLDTHDLLHRWRAGRETLADLLARADPAARIAWFGPPMSSRSMITARLMETWAHGTDIADTLGVPRTPTARLRDIAHLGVRTRDFAHRLHGRPVPDVEFRIELEAPDGNTWIWGSPDATERVAGPALDFCLVVTQRRTLDGTALQVSGDQARDWLTIAQVFAGRPTRTGDRRVEP